MGHFVFISFILAILAVCWIHPRLVKIALMKNIVDNPDARKLQRTPVPVLGGIAVFFGAVIGVGFMTAFVDCSQLLVTIVAMMVMLYTGTMDDILDLSASMRFVIEIGIVFLTIAVSGYMIDDFHGLWGIGQIPGWVALPLSIFAAVGIINSINLIDGVNGLSSGFCVFACIIFGTYFYLTGNTEMMILATVAAGSLIPFFLHNVFGKTSKMFIGDGGTLVMGIILSTFVLQALSSKNCCEMYVQPNFGVVPFTLAVLAVPVFDTLRVMLSRIARGTSPFHPDKTHLHHMFIDLGFSHAGTTVSILTLSSLIFLAQWGLYHLGASIDVQLYVVLFLGLLFTSGLYFGVERISKQGFLYRQLRKIAQWTCFERQGIFLWLQKVIDKI